MNLNFNQKNDKNRRIISIILCFLLVFAFIGSSEDDSYGNPAGAAIAISGEGVLGGMMSAYGYSNMSATDINNTWNSLSQTQQAALYLAGQNAKTTGDMGIAQVTLAWDNSNYMSVADFRILEESLITDFDDGVPGGDPLSEYNEYKLTYPSSLIVNGVDVTESVNTYVNSIDSSYNVLVSYSSSSLNVKSFPPDANVYLYEVAYSLGYKLTGVCTNYNIISRTFNGSAPYDSTVNKGASLGSFTPNELLKFYYSRSPIRVLDSTKSTLKGYLSSESIANTVIYNPNYNNPLPTTATGAITIGVPYTDNPDTNVQIPEDNSISNPVTLETVLQGYESIDGFFKDGGTITLADGTVIGNVHDATRSDGNQWSDVNVSDSSEPWAYQIPILGEILKWLKKIAAAIGAGVASIIAFLTTMLQNLIDTITDPFNWEKKPGGEGLGGKIANIFEPLLLLLLAIIALIGKIIIFIGQLYNIPANSSMLHPTMIQGLEWARGFHTSGGVNLYGLITGIISIVLGIVVFKLLRKMITGIGTASYIEEKETIPNGMKRTGGW